MRKFKVFLCTLVCGALLLVFGTEVFAASYLTLTVSGNVTFAATDIGAKIYGAYALGSEKAYLVPTSNETGATEQNHMLILSGEEEAFTGVTFNFGDIHLVPSSNSFVVYVFITNTGSRFLLPNVETQTYNNFTITKDVKFLDKSAGQLDPSTLTTGTASNFISQVNTALNSAQPFGASSSLDNEDTYCCKITLTYNYSQITPGAIDADLVSSSFRMEIGFGADIQYSSTANGVLSVYQPINSSSSAWTKYGQNTIYTATPTKINTNNLETIKGYLQNGTNGNSTQTLRDTYSESAPVYKDIDVVNVNVDTGEIIGKLSDPNYKFEWFGGSVTLPAGTTLASGRTLANEETFSRVDCYTYYPTMYLRRWIVANNQWISVSDHAFAGASKVEGWYVGTFEAYYFNADNTLAWINVNGTKSMIPRSFAYDVCPATSGSTAYFVNNYGFTNPDNVTILGTEQSNQMKAASNLTKAWEAYATANPSLKSAYTYANGVQGENWKTYVYNLLLQIKYANNNLQSRVGNGNSSTYSPYSASGISVTTYTNKVMDSTNGFSSWYTAAKGGATIGVYNSSSKGTATYSQRDGKTRLSETGYNSAGMNYGYNSTYQHTNQYTNSEKQGLYMQQYLTYHKMEGGTLTDRYMVDGFVGSDAYTSVWCLGQANPWSNIWHWVFGSAVIWDCSDTNNKLGYLYTSFEDYDYKNPTTTWLMTSGSGFTARDADLRNNRHYSQMTYNLPTASGSYNYLGLSAAVDTGLQTLIGMQDKNSSANNGLGDYFYMSATESYVFGVLRGGIPNNGGGAGPFYFGVTYAISYTSANVGFRPALIS